MKVFIIDTQAPKVGSCLCFKKDAPRIEANIEEGMTIGQWREHLAEKHSIAVERSMMMNGKAPVSLSKRDGARDIMIYLHPQEGQVFMVL